MWIIILTTLTVSTATAGKYRTEKINYIYDKALQHIQDRQRLSKLEGELSSYDGIYLDAKDRHSNGKVDDLNKEMIKVDKKLIVLLEKYGLEKTVQAFKEKMKLKNAWEYKEENLVLPSEKFTDPKLQKLWQQALISKFSDSEMIELHKELKEVERKTRIYEDSLRNFNKGPHENDLESEHEHVERKNKDLKVANKEMNEHMAAVHKKITDDEYSPFTESKVKKLWKLAQSNANFSMHDLDILKEELLHFDNQLKKIEFHKTELQSMKETREKEGKSHLHSVEGAELDARFEKIARKVRKLEKYLETKVTHSEL